MSKAILDTAEVIHDYMRNGDRSTSREECITWIARLIQEVSQQAPSATVDEKRITIDDVVELQRRTDAILHSKQPTVSELQNELERLKPFEEGYIRQAELLTASIAREDELEAKLAQQPSVDVDAIIGAYKKHPILGIGASRNEQLLRNVLTEALRGSYTIEDMFRAYMRRLPKHFLAEGLVKSFQDREDFNKYMSQYDTEKGKSNGN